MRYGIRGNAASLIRSYLQHRSQIVTVDDSSSDPLPVLAGVPQGSILGPFLFNMFVNDIVCSTNTPAKFINYADDTSIFLTGNVADDLIDEANLTLHRLDEWTQKNCLKINIAKTKVVLFRAKNKTAIIKKSVSLRSTAVEIVPSIKILGVIFQENLSWDSHVNFLIAKLSQVLGLLYRNRHILPRNIMLLVYNTLFLSRINYCHLVWASTTQTNLHGVHKLQKKFVRILENVPMFSHTQDLFPKYNILPITIMYDYLTRKAITQATRNDSQFFSIWQTYGKISKRTT